MIITKEIESTVPFLYSKNVSSGKIVTGKFIRLAIERFYSWIKNAEAKGYFLDHANGMHVIDFFEEFLVYTKHPDKTKIGKPFVLSPFQQFTLYNIFAWKHQDSNLRVINTVYDKRAKKNGKTAEMAGLGLYCMAFDDEPEAEVYIGATKEDQAKLCFNQAVNFINNSKKLAAIGFRTLQNKIIFKRNNSFMRPLGGDSKTQDGINSHLSIIDEYHAHKDDTVKENLESSAISRPQPLVYHITTAGFNLSSVCKLYEDSCKDVLLGLKEEDSTLIMIHDLDEGDDWEDESVWPKANPNLNVSALLDRIRSEYTKAVNQPSKIPNFKTKHLNLWVDAPSIWIPNEIWMRNKVDTIPLEKFQEFGSYRAIDLSTTTDITADIILSEPDDEDIRYIKPFFFCPSDTITRRSKQDRVPYRYWKDQGFLIATPGNTVDYTYIKDNVFGTNRKYNVKRIELDQWNASQVANDLTEEGLDVSFFSQQISIISFPTKQFEKLVYEGKIKHDGNPVLTWMLSGCVIYQDANENIKVHKGQSHAGVKRVDGIVATIMALGGSLSNNEETEKSQYNDPDVEVFI
ncbi:terminase large subunit [Aquimarina sp. Aq78]|uniref:terminase large subunit n=1 Tax=Aquimarina sp. Aq78 TaxID=1191889 RepID=UPI000D0E9B62|nr:terminase TerL endonuclease subunit [Aquimarina sp. Aq78]